jgi:hypothetical protein
MKIHHEYVADLHKVDGGMPMKHHHEHVEQQHKANGGMPMKHHHEHVAKMCGGGMAKRK